MENYNGVALATVSFADTCTDSSVYYPVSCLAYSAACQRHCIYRQNNYQGGLMKTIKRIFAILLLIVTVVLVGYFLYTGSRLSITNDIGGLYAT
jgi:hypothetical protein